MTDSVQEFSTHDLQLLLEFLTTISEISLEVKLFAFLALCIATNVSSLRFSFMILK